MARSQFPPIKQRSLAVQFGMGVLSALFVGFGETFIREWSGVQPLATPLLKLSARLAHYIGANFQIVFYTFLGVVAVVVLTPILIFLHSRGLIIKGLIGLFAGVFLTGITWSMHQYIGEHVSWYLAYLTMFLTGVVGPILVLNGRMPSIPS